MNDLTHNHKIWETHWQTAQRVRQFFGVDSALEYLVGEKLEIFANRSNHCRECARELPHFRTAVSIIFSDDELQAYLATVKPFKKRRALRKIFEIEKLRENVDFSLYYG